MAASSDWCHFLSSCSVASRRLGCTFPTADAQNVSGGAREGAERREQTLEKLNNNKRDHQYHKTSQRLKIADRYVFGLNI